MYNCTTNEMEWNRYCVVERKVDIKLNNSVFIYHKSNVSINWYKSDYLWHILVDQPTLIAVSLSSLVTHGRKQQCIHVHCVVCLKHCNHDLVCHLHFVSLFNIVYRKTAMPKRKRDVCLSVLSILLRRSSDFRLSTSQPGNVSPEDKEHCVLQLFFILF